MMQVPAFTNVTLVPLMVQTRGVFELKVTARPESEDAETLTGLLSGTYWGLLGPVKLMVCGFPVTVKLAEGTVAIDTAALLIEGRRLFAGTIMSLAESVSEPKLSGIKLLKVAPVPATVVAVSPAALPVPEKVSVMGMPPTFWPFSVTETIGAGVADSLTFAV